MSDAILGLQNNFQRYRQQGARILQLCWYEMQISLLSLSARAIAFFIQTVFVFELSSSSLYIGSSFVLEDKIYNT